MLWANRVKCLHTIITYNCILFNHEYMWRRRVFSKAANKKSDYLKVKITRVRRSHFCRSHVYVKLFEQNLNVHFYSWHFNTKTSLWPCPETLTRRNIKCNHKKSQKKKIIYEIRGGVVDSNDHRFTIDSHQFGVPDRSLYRRSMIIFYARFISILKADISDNLQF